MLYICRLKCNKIKIYCKCGICFVYFDVTKKKRAKFCSNKCREKNYRNEKVDNDSVTLKPV